ncbi:haloacid dehalogenase [Flavobacteriales bacterium 34_180_T64]|nr:haloacid dehalogenase [Flavobacteriales bacterium 34_180_T64]
MIKTLIFDFGDVFINLDKQGAMQTALNLFEFDEFPEELLAVNSLYEQGLLTTREFLESYTDNFPEHSEQDIIKTWNCILKDFPIHRLEFIQQLAKENKYKLILLSNTNTLHIDWIIEHVPFYNDFKAAFNAFYLSHEIHLRKPDREIFDFVLKENSLLPEETLFIDDTEENIIAAKTMRIHTWQIDPITEDVVNLFTAKKELF